MTLQEHYDNGNLGTMTFGDIDTEDIPTLIEMMNEPLEREGCSKIARIEGDGCEDINVIMSDGQIIETCMETTMDDIWTEAGLPE